MDEGITGLVEVKDVTDRWIGEAPFDDGYILIKIADAEDTILSFEPNLLNLIPDPIPVFRFKRVVANMVLRHLKNPDGIRQEQETTDVTSASRTYAGADPGAIVFTDDDKKALFGRGKGAYTISMEAPDIGYGVRREIPDTWWSHVAPV